MDNSILKKKLNTYKSGKSGRLQQVGDEVVIEVLRAWENWPGASTELCRDLGLSKMQLVTMIQKAKRLVKAGVIPESEFKEIKIAGAESGSGGGTGCPAIEVAWDQGKVIRFSGVELLVDFLKKVA